MRFPGDMAGSNIGPMVISGSKSELSEQWRIWLQGFTYQPTPTKSRENEKQIILSGRFWNAGFF